MPFRIVRNDITKMQADAIVNTANPKPAYADGTDRAVYQAAGACRLLAEREKIGDLAVGQAAATPAFGLNAKYIIHTVGPIWQGGGHGEEGLLKSCYENSLSLALSRQCGSIAFPLVATGANGFPKERALAAALAVISKFLTQHEMLVYLVVFDEESFHLSESLFEEVGAFIDRHYVQEKISQEYLQGNARAGALPRQGESPRSLPVALMGPPPEPMESKALPERVSPSARGARGRSLAQVMEEVGETFQERLLRLIDERDMTNAEVYKKANLDRKLFSKILCNPSYHPRKHTVLSFAIALELNLDETKDLLARAEYALSPSSKFDLVVEYFIVHGVYDVFTINTALFDYGLPMLGE